MEKSIIYPLAQAGAGYPKRAGDTKASTIRKYHPRVSSGVRTANFILLSGTTGVGPEGFVVATDDPREQAKVCMRRLRTTLETGGGRLTDIFKLRWFLATAEVAAEVRRGFEDYLTENGVVDWPVMSFCVSDSSSGVTHVEVEAFAATSGRFVRTDGQFDGLAQDAASPSFRHAVEVGNLCFTGGHLPVDAHGRLVSADPQVQLDAALDGLTATLRAAGHDPADLIRLTVWVDDEIDAAMLKAALDRFLAAHCAAGRYPTGVVLQVPIGVPGAHVSVEGVAGKGEKAWIDAPADAPGFSAGVKIALDAEEGSYLRRFTWPAVAHGEPPAVPPHFEIRHPLGNLLFTSLVNGQDGPSPPGQSRHDRMAEQAMRVFERLEAIAVKAGGRFADYAHLGIYFIDPALYEEYNIARIKFVERANPDKDWFAGTGTTGRSMDPDGFLHIEGIAAIA